MRAAIHALKYDRMHPAARRMGAMLAQAMAKLAGEAPNEMLVVPVPLHRSKHAERGFNQARVLALYALRALRRSHPEWKLTLAPSTLMRLRATGSQAGLTPRQRRMNVRGAFQVANAAAVEGKHVLLVDDILTTGRDGAGCVKDFKASRRGHGVGGNAGAGGTGRVARKSRIRKRSQGGRHGGCGRAAAAGYRQDAQAQSDYS